MLAPLSPAEILVTKRVRRALPQWDVSPEMGLIKFRGMTRRFTRAERSAINRDVAAAEKEERKQKEKKHRYARALEKKPLRWLTSENYERIAAYHEEIAHAGRLAETMSPGHPYAENFRRIHELRLAIAAEYRVLAANMNAWERKEYEEDDQLERDTDDDWLWEGQ